MDINAAHVRWIHEHFDAPLCALQCSTLPHLLIEDDSVRLVYAFSVFTHIDEFELAWLCELRRILAPGGVAYLTFHSEASWENAKRHVAVREGLLKMREVRSGAPVTVETLAGPMPSERVVFTYSPNEAVYSKNVFHSAAYIRRVWGRFVTVLDIHETGHAAHQGVAVLRKDA